MTEPELTLEDVLTRPDMGRLAASPAQLAICRIADGRDARGLLSREEIVRHLGAEPPPGWTPEIVALVCGVRGGKSRIAAAAAIAGALRADMSAVEPYEEVWLPVIAPRESVARATSALIRGLLQAPGLAGLVVGRPTSEQVVLRRPDGRQVMLVIAAAAAGGVTVRNRWLAGLILEEVAQLGAEALGSAVTAEEILSAAETRLLPRAQAWLISSPYGPQGLLYDAWRAHWGQLGRRWLIVRAPTRWLNPTFPQSRIDELRASDPDRAAREYDAAWADADAAYLEAVLVDRCTRAADGDVPRAPGHTYVAVTDPATRGNAWTVGIATMTAERRCVVAAVRQWVGSRTAPLRPSEVLREIAALCRAYGVSMVETDPWAADALRDIAEGYGLTLAPVAVTQDGRTERYRRLRELLAEERIDLPRDGVLRADLLGVRRRATASGVQIHLPRTADGRHCDYAPVMAGLAVAWVPAPPVVVRRTAEEDLLAEDDAEWLGEETPEWRRRCGTHGQVSRGRSVA